MLSNTEGSSQSHNQPERTDTITVTPDPDNEPLTEERVRAIVRDEIHELIVAPVVNFANDMTTVISASAINGITGLLSGI